MSFLSHLRQAQIDTVNEAVERQDAIISDYLAWLAETEDTSPAARKLTIIARSPASAAVKAMIARTGDLRAAEVNVRVILANLEPEAALGEVKQALTLMNAGHDDDEFARWAKNAALLDAHEQVTLGTHMCWSGDAMRRDAGKRDSLDLFESDAPHTVRLGLLAFDAIWAVSVAIPGLRKADAPARRPLASQARPASTELPSSSLLTRLNRLTATWH